MTYDQAQSPRLGQRTQVESTSVRMFSGEEIPEASWIGQMIYRTDTQGLQVFNGDAWEDVVGGTAGLLTYVGPEIPSGGQTGDLWFDSNNGNEPHRFNGLLWISMRDGTIAIAQSTAEDAQAIADDAAADAAAAVAVATTAQGVADQAIADAADALATADGKVRTFFQNDAPTGMTTGDVGDLWFDLNDLNKMYRWSGTAWVLSDDQRISSTATLAAGKITTYYQTGPPVSTAIGDLWVDTDDGNKLYRAQMIGADAITAGEWVSVQDTTIATASAAASAAQTSANNALTTAQTAQATADGAIRTHYAATPPWANGATGHLNDAGDMWFDTDDGQAYRWNDLTKTWEVIEDQSIGAALAAAQDAQITADGKITAYYATTQPVVGEVGDLWYDTDAGNKPYYCSSIAPVVYTALPVGMGALAGDVTARSLGSIVTTVATTAPAAGMVAGDLWMDSDDGNKLYRWDGDSWEIVQDAGINQAITEASDAADLADSKMRIFFENTHASGLYPASNPTMLPADLGDLWYRLDNGNQAHRWDGEQWIPTPAGSAALMDNLITFDKLHADAMNGTTITGAHIRTNVDSDKGIHLDAQGLRAYDNVGGKPPFLDVDPAQGLVIVAGKGTFQTLTVTGDPVTGTGAELGKATTFPPGSSVTLRSATPNPSSPPTVSSGFATSTVPNAPGAGWSTRRGWSLTHDGTGWFTFNADSGRGEKYDFSGNRVAFGDVIPGWQPSSWGASVCGISSHYYVICKRNATVGGGVALGWFLNRLNNSLNMVDSAPESNIVGGGAWYFDSNGKCPSLGYEDVSSTLGPVIISQARSNGQVRIQRVNHLTTNASTVYATLNPTGLMEFDYNHSQVLFNTGTGANTPFDFSGATGTGDRYIFTNWSGATQDIRVWNATTASWEIEYDWSSGASTTGIVGLFWDDTEEQWTLKDRGTKYYYYYTANQDKDIPLGDDFFNKWVSHTFWKDDVTDRETEQSPKAQVVAKKRGTITMTANALPVSPGANEPTQVRFYLGEGATEPVRTAMHKLNYGMTDGQETLTVEAYDLTGPNPPAANNFSGGTPAFVRSESGDPHINLQGDGAGQTGPHSWGNDGTTRHIALMRSTTAVQAIAGISYVKINLTDTPLLLRDITVSASVATINKAGVYELDGGFRIATGVDAGYVTAVLEYFTGAEALGSGIIVAMSEVRPSTAGGGVVTVRCATKAVLAAGVQMRLIGRQNTGSSKNLDNDPSRAYMNIQRCG